MRNRHWPRGSRARWTDGRSRTATSPTLVTVLERATEPARFAVADEDIERELVRVRPRLDRGRVAAQKTCLPARGRLRRGRGCRHRGRRLHLRPASRNRRRGEGARRARRPELDPRAQRADRVGQAGNVPLVDADVLARLLARDRALGPADRRPDGGGGARRARTDAALPSRSAPAHRRLELPRVRERLRRARRSGRVLPAGARRQRRRPVQARGRRLPTDPAAAVPAGRRPDRAGRDRRRRDVPAEADRVARERASGLSHHDREHRAHSTLAGLRAARPPHAGAHSGRAANRVREAAAEARREAPDAGGGADASVRGSSGTGRSTGPASCVRSSESTGTRAPHTASATGG